MIIRELKKSDVLEVSKILSCRHRDERRSFEGLNKIFEDVELLEKIVSKKLEEDLLVSSAAFEGDKLLGFIISSIKTDKVFGRCAWVKYDGLALADGVNPDLYRELYADIAVKWIKLGCLKHFVIVPSAREDVINSWLKSGFAYEQVFGIKKLEYSKIEDVDGVLVKKATIEDKSDLESVSSLILSYQAKSPTYAVALPEMFDEIRRGYGGLASDEDSHVLLAYNEKQLLGFTCGYFDGDDNSNMMMPYKGTELGVAATNPDFQSRGVGTLLTKSLFNASIDAGYEYSITDWRITNMKSSVFWPKMGYEAYAYRFVRTIDPRAYWADGFTRL